MGAALTAVARATGVRSAGYGSLGVLEVLNVVWLFLPRERLATATPSYIFRMTIQIGETSAGKLNRSPLRSSRWGCPMAEAVLSNSSGETVLNSNMS